MAFIIIKASWILAMFCQRKARNTQKDAFNIQAKSCDRLYSAFAFNLKGSENLVQTLEKKYRVSFKAVLFSGDWSQPSEISLCLSSKWAVRTGEVPDTYLPGNRIISMRKTSSTFRMKEEKSFYKNTSATCRFV